MLTHLSLFSGIGGLDLAAEWASFQTVGQCEWADFPHKVLEKHWPDVPKWRDIRTLTGDGFYERTGMRTVDIISGGFPCQPFSKAGKLRGEQDNRFLWPEMLRIVKELRPPWVVGENVANITNVALDTTIFDLETEGYEARAFVFPACAVGAYHKQERVAIVAHHSSIRSIYQQYENHTGKARKLTQSKAATGIPLGNVGYGGGFDIAEERFPTYQSRLCRDVHGIPGGMDRIECIGNAVVPQQFYPIFQAIADIESPPAYGR